MKRMVGGHYTSYVYSCMALKTVFVWICVLSRYDLFLGRKKKIKKVLGKWIVLVVGS